MENPHRRFNILTGEWILVSPHRSDRPWQGQSEKIDIPLKPKYDKDCYLCPGNKRANGEFNPNYSDTFVFVNDFSALLPENQEESINERELLVAKPERGICKVVCFSPDHSLTLPDLSEKQLLEGVKVWKNEYENLGKKEFVNHVQIFENKGSLMGASNPHPHCQIWAQESLPMESLKETKQQKKYFDIHKSTLLLDYLHLEKQKSERIIFENENFTVLVPYWAVWPFETMILANSNLQSFSSFNNRQLVDFGEAISILTKKYDRLFNVSFPYSSGIHQSPTDGSPHPEWQFHMHFYPPLLRSATVKKFMVGYEMLGNPQRDITAELAAEKLRNV
ncbi:MAG: UDP-glucose--hexose-1-phosphate uridylyltransferase [Melioribacteraceae bacterium]|nr:UDP-glucose--hexose-1-phosphate uridylyltransferase [Melioribacteraceae bacterium]MCF8263200.1 UDP-glucose--hexose-1-phosphate uridylyltransferase [Melioribacteraceae bacterium]MCF8412711.1 UDP-glucose--hexose-1-phosphate uridylyltransferase [Melioribacteraceae bacterium]MCF8431282.1 UDP-glucose--hexose-1-phosphate uridylyltransferase [Melioribacteraceae bacterium]